MELRTEIQEPDIVIVYGSGKLNMVSAPALKSLVAGAIDNGQVRVVVDLSGIDFMDSSGLGALVGCLKSARQAGGDLRIANPTKQVAMVLKLSNLDRVLATYATAELAFHD